MIDLKLYKFSGLKNYSSATHKHTHKFLHQKSVKILCPYL